MKRFKAYLDQHPIIAIIVFDFICFPITLLIGVAIEHFGHFGMGNIIFFESIFILMICSSAINGNSDSRMLFGQPVHTNMNQHNYYLESYHFAIKYGSLGILLFLSSGYFGMK